ncbi:DUF7115 domain-containing protein [Natronomonas sp.]|uniref:DUF7115 domain-containing protein n=1 Tax=Natronomonas sp. TaxID=2184060 RepID=UPI00261C5529|nr:hypothetical protein [Natronomonas sp.]
METLPELLSEAIAGATVLDTVDIGGGDAVAVTNEATHLYRSDGLLTDESVETFGHDAERLSVRSKRRKSEIGLETIDGATSFTVPSKVADRIVEAMLGGVLRATGVLADDDEILARFRFSELTLVVTDSYLLEHVGSAVWDADFDTVEYAELTGLDFERGSVATQVVIETATRRRRVKVPNDHAGRVRRQIQEAAFEFYGVSSIDALREALAPDTDGEDAGPSPGADAGAGAGARSGTGSSAADAGSTRDPEASAGGSGTDSDADADADGFVSPDWTPPADQDIAASGPERTTKTSDGPESAPTDDAAADRPAGRPTGPELEALSEQVEALSEQVERQTELLESQRELIDRLVDELRRGR